MSSQLTIAPYNRIKTILSLDLKLALRRKHNEKIVSYMIVTESDIPYFEGLRDAGIEHAELVISFIGKYGECLIDEEF